MLAKTRTWLHKDVNMFLRIQKVKQIEKKWEIIKTEICDLAFFPVSNNQIGIHFQIKILTSCKYEQYDFNEIKISGI